MHMQWLLTQYEQIYICTVQKRHSWLISYTNAKTYNLLYHTAAHFIKQIGANIKLVWLYLSLTCLLIYVISILKYLVHYYHPNQLYILETQTN